MFKMGFTWPIWTSKTQVMPKEGPWVKLAVWFPTTKVKNRHDFLACRWRATYRWKALNKVYNFVLDVILIEGLYVELWGPKVAGVPTLAISRLPFGSPRTKCHLDVGLVETHTINYKGEGGGFPQVRAVVNFVSLSLLVVCFSIKNVQTMH
jgi:hypothetical protein